SSSYPAGGLKKLLLNNPLHQSVLSSSVRHRKTVFTTRCRIIHIQPVSFGFLIGKGNRTVIMGRAAAGTAEVLHENRVTKETEENPLKSLKDSKL
ncbi:MAG: hypothetical protein ACSW8K_07480, partial [bacterium]